MKKLRNTFGNRIPFLAIFIALPIVACDEMQFYRATPLFTLPRFEKSWLTSFDLDVAYGSTKSARNSSGHTVSALDVYGTQNMHLIGFNVPGKDLSKLTDVIITELALVPAGENFGVFSLHGTFNLLELNARFTQNFTHGFFTYFHLPIRKITVENVCFEDLTPTTGCFNNSSPEWLLFKNQFEAILNAYDIFNCQKNCSTRTAGCGDLSMYIGWTNSYQDTRTIDFLDTTLKIGLLAPTGKVKNINELFSFPLGYDGHYGIPITADTAFGMYEWLTVGLHVDALMFFDATHNVRIKTAAGQSGIIKLAKTCAKINRGTQWTVGGFLQADHFAQGLSLTVGYSYASKRKDEIQPLNCCCFNTDIANSDEMLQSWNMQTVNFFAEYDFTGENNIFGPRLGLFYNLQVAGKRVLKNNMAGANFGLEISHNF